jgi:glyoxylate/hydroxypyruvate reductase A
MSVQMASTCHAVIRHFREFDGYAADVAHGKVVRKPKLRDFPSAFWGWCWEAGVRLRQFEFPVRGGAVQPKQCQA